MFAQKKKLGAAFAVTFAGALVLAGCSTGGDSASDEGMEETAPQETQTEEMDPAANLVGPGCEMYAEQVPDGDGSIQGMAQDPVAVAASNNPMLTTLVSAVSGELNPDVNLVDTLNGDEFTVFAPVDDAFAKIDEGTIDTLKTDSDLLTKILTYHVVPGQIEPADIAGEHETVEGQMVEVTGEGDELMVNDANVVCGGVQTANATVYLVDSVLMPPEE
ncbi:cell surface glycolipoprotein Mpt83 [Leucobacter tardus]|uniref:Fasciclin domain-containing protein n=1 Tax=Leucobacter tardus TaxID=501483 RepID=A0A939QE32_9MICO|nr:fasciclin domain-containing protein [Leucobacter tardus]MBO2990112.1 fasciclin domain-containing protein [Leucobacter tardus]